MNTSSKPSSLILVTNGDDGQGLYVDGRLFADGHEVTLSDLARALGFELEIREVSTTWLGEEVCYLPVNLKDIPPEAYL